MFAVLVALASLALGSGCSPARRATLGFWFETVTYQSSRFGGSLSAYDLRLIDRVARSEIVTAFAGLRVDLTERHDARYRLRVVQQLNDPRFRGSVAVAGASRAVSMFAGDGAVNFSMLAAYAESYAPADADRAAIVAAMGRGIGRAAVHEFVHQLIGSGEFDGTKDASTYEYGSAARKEQYYGPLHWGPTRSVLEHRLGILPR
jgi:hypothetical protein